MDINNRYYVKHHEHARHEAIVLKVSTGLGIVLETGILPPNYRDVFRSGVFLCEELCESISHASDEELDANWEHLIEVFESALYFTNLDKCYSRVYECITTAEDILDAASDLDILSRDDASPYAFPDSRIVSLQEFFLALWAALSEGRTQKNSVRMFDFATYPEVSRRNQ